VLLYYIFVSRSCLKFEFVLNSMNLQTINVLEIEKDFKVSYVLWAEPPLSNWTGLADWPYLPSALARQ
jgi:hypothetical protein